VEVPEIPEEPVLPEEPEIFEEPTIIELPTEPTVSDIDALVPGPAPTPVPTPTPAPAPMPKPAGDSLLEMVPAESLFCVRINSFDFTLSQIDQFLAGAAPIPMMTSMLVRMQLAQVLGSPQLAGVNMGGDFVIFVPIPSRDVDPDSVGILIPITNYEQFVTGNANVSKPDENGISKIASSEIDTLLTTKLKDYALVSAEGNETELMAMAKAISEGMIKNLATALDASEAQKAANQAIWAYANTEAAPSSLGLGTAAGNLINQFTMPAVSAGMLSPSDVNETDLENLTKQIRYLSLALDPKPNVLNITSAISAVPGTEMAQTLSADSATVLAFGQMLGGKDPKQMGPQLKSISALIPNADQASFVGTHNLIDLIKKVAAFSPVPMPQIDAKANSSMAFAVKVGEGALSAEIALPKEHLAEIIAALMKLQPVMVPGQPMTPVGPAPTIPQEALTIQPGVGMGPIRFGRSIDMASQVLGRPDRVTGNANEYHSLGLAIVASNDGTVASILCGDTSRPDSPLIKACKCRTKEGIGMGSGRREVIRAYRRPSSTKRNDIPGQGTTVVLEYERIGAQFTLRNDKVVHMMFRQSRPASR
jgi:hypothetical protein